MKKIFLPILFTLLLISVSCTNKKESKATPASNQKENIKNYVVDTQNSVINWTAYKTTEKVPVKGIFKEVQVLSKVKASNPTETINNLEFEIPVASIFSNDSIRDYKLTTFFFGVMKNTLKLKGKITTQENGKGIINLSMNGLTKDLPFTYEVHDKNIDINSVMNLDNWEAQAAIASLNKVCNGKHTGADGVSKTWSEVAIHILVKTKSE